MEVWSHLATLPVWNVHFSEAELAAVSSVTNTPDIGSLHSELFGIV